MNKNMTNWEDIYHNNKAGSFLRFPSENLVSLFFQNRNSINLNGKCLDYGFGSANNSEFIIQNMNEIYGIEISESSVNIARERLKKYSNFNQANFMVSSQIKENDFHEYFDLVVAWQMLYYNNARGLTEMIDELYNYLKTNAVIICTMITRKDIKVKHAKKMDENTFMIDNSIPDQEGCLVYSPEDENALLQLFKKFEIIDYGYYERGSFQSKNTASEYYLVGRRK